MSSEAQQLSVEAQRAVYADEVERQYMNLKQERDELKTQLDAAQKSLAEAAAKGGLEQTVVELESQNKVLASKLGGLEDEKKLAEERCERVSSESDRLRAEVT